MAKPNFLKILTAMLTLFLTVLAGWQSMQCLIAKRKLAADRTAAAELERKISEELARRDAFKQLAAKAVSERDAAVTRMLQEMERRHRMWCPVFVDDFSGAFNVHGWVPRQGKWIIADGKLRAVSEDVEEPVVVCGAADFSGDLQVTYRARTVESGWCDLSLMTDLPDNFFLNNEGYTFCFGAKGNRYSGLQGRGGQWIVKNGRILITRWKWHRITAQRTGKWFGMTVNRMPVFLCLEPNYSARTEDKSGAIYTYRSQIEVDDFVVAKPIPFGPEEEKRFRERIAAEMDGAGFSSAADRE